MTSANLISFVNYIKSQNTYFDKGYGIAFKDEATKQVFCPDNEKFIAVMPNDTLGNYFYIRYEKGVEFSEDFAGRPGDCPELGLSFNDRMNVILVACVRDADELKLLNNLRATCAKFSTLKAIPKSATLIRELVVASELSGMEKEDIESALQRLSGWTIISMSIALTSSYIPTNCVINPCKSC